MNLDDFIVVGKQQQVDAREKAASFMRAYNAGELESLLKNGSIIDKYDAYEHLGHGTTALFRTTANQNIKHELWLSKSKSTCLKEYFQYPTPVFKIENFSNSQIREIAMRSQKSLSILEIKHHLRSIGIILIYQPFIPGSKIDGAAFKLPNGTPCVSISMRFKRADNIWFTLLHELAHVALHYNDLDVAIIDDMEAINDSKAERQANALASNSICPRDIYRSLKSKITTKEKDLLEDAKLAQVHPALLAGIIRHSTSYTIFGDQVNSDQYFEETVKGITE